MFQCKSNVCIIKSVVEECMFFNVCFYFLLVLYILYVSSSPGLLAWLSGFWHLACVLYLLKYCVSPACYVYTHHCAIDELHLATGGRIVVKQLCYVLPNIIACSG